MTAPDIFQAVGTVIGFAVAGFYAKRAEKQTRAIGNGWADDVIKRLGRIEKKQDTQEERIKRLEDGK